MFMLKVLVGIAVLALISVGGYFLVTTNKAHSAAQQEITLQQSEKQECQKRLTMIYGAWKKYKVDHKGQEPANIEQLIPKYISDTNMLVCPTAQRWINNHKAIDRGIIRVDKKEIFVTYEFLWLGSNGAANVRKYGDKAPLVACSSHEEGVYLAVYHTKPKLDAFEAETRSHYVAELQNAHVLAARRNGTVGDLTTSEE